MRPIVDGLAREYDGRVRVVRLNYSDARMRAVVAEYGATVYPALVFVRADGSRAELLLGETDEAHVRRGLATLLDG
ncbi:MAG: hypothetical protein NVSMB42_15150 [Herpetosiphon sp.]